MFGAWIALSNSCDKLSTAAMFNVLILGFPRLFSTDQSQGRTGKFGNRFYLVEKKRKID